MRIIQTGIFEKKVKKLAPRQKAQLDDAIRDILKDPGIGEQKKGDLREVRIHKFYVDKTQYLLAYAISQDCLELLMIGPHENYYSELKNYLRKR
jgi:mRNA-degrading endonuclease RelE of RelBE toxin-antitoxin system